MLQGLDRASAPGLASAPRRRVPLGRRCSAPRTHRPCPVNAVQAAPAVPVPPRPEPHGAPQARQRTYYLLLRKPLGVQFAYDADSQRVHVHAVHGTCDASNRLLLQQGDWLKQVGDLAASNGRWRPHELAQLRKVLASDSDAKAILERPPSTLGERPLYVPHAAGRAGTCGSTRGSSRACDGVLLQLHAGGDEERGPGLRASFTHGCDGRGASAAALARPNAWRASLAASAATAPRLIFPGRLCNGGVTASDNGKLQVIWPERNGAVETVESTERVEPITKTSANIVPCDFLGSSSSDQEPPSTPKRDPRPSPMSWMRRLKPPPAAPQQPAGPVRPHVVAVLPWLLVATGPLLPADLPVVATEYGLNVVAHLRLRIAAHRHIAVPGAPAGTPLMDLLQCICALHRSGSSVGLSDATGAAAARKAVLLYCTAHPARWAPQVATLVVAYLHLVARLGLHESAAKVARLLRTPPDLVLLAKLCRKLEAEARFRPTRLQLTWPYSSAEVQVSTCLATQPPLTAGSAPGAAAQDDGGWQEWETDPMIRAADGSHTMQVQVPASRRRQVLRFRFKVGGVPSVDPGQVHRRGGDGVVTNVAVLPAVPMRGNTAAAVRSGARVALAAALRGPPVDFDAKS